jgi:hypothetical protein
MHLPRVKEADKKSHTKYYQTHKTQIIAKQTVYHATKKEAWGISNGKIGKQAEEIAKRILNIEGFTDLFNPYSTFLFDYIARKSGQVHFIEVASCFKKRLKQTQLKVAKYLNIPIVILFIRPNLKEYRLIYPKTPDVSATSTLYESSIQQIPQEYLMEET